MITLKRGKCFYYLKIYLYEYIIPFHWIIVKKNNYVHKFNSKIYLDRAGHELTQIVKTLQLTRAVVCFIGEIGIGLYMK